MSKIALVHVALLVGGIRTVFAPGEELPELPKHDEVALINSKSISDPTADAAAERAGQAEQRKGEKEFRDARLLVQAEAESRTTDVGSGEDAGTAGSGTASTAGTALDGDGTGTALPPVSQALRSAAGTATARLAPAVKNAAKATRGGKR
ncbi:hypothetical protein [Variovorax boronicumulans]|uniref:hypothetical protein n=1 Tax=Variovorax boronicumulans TaxID=436515 RepID=UPI001C589061